MIHAIPEAYQNEDTFYLVYKKKEATQSVLPQTGSQEVALFWVKSSHSFLCGPSYFLKAPKEGYGRPFDWSHGTKSSTSS